MYPNAFGKTGKCILDIPHEIDQAGTPTFFSFKHIMNGHKRMTNQFLNFIENCSVLVSQCQFGTERNF